MDPWVVEVLKEGYRIPFLSMPPLSEDPLMMHSYNPTSVKGRALEAELLALEQKGALEVASTSPGYYSRMFVVTKATGGWRPIIDLSLLNKYVTVSKFRMETVQSVLTSIRRGDWMISIDLKDAYLQVPVHPDSRKFLRFATPRKIFQFKVLCFGLTTAPQVFTRVMAPVSALLHAQGVRILRYLDDWLVLASSREACVTARDMTLELCLDLGIRVNLDKSHLCPAQTATYLGMVIDAKVLRASPTPERRERLLCLLQEFLSSEQQPASLWRVLLGHLSSLTQLIPGGRLRMRALQFALRRQWDSTSQEESHLVSWDEMCYQDLVWWSNPVTLEQGTYLENVSPDLMFWSDASDMGWGAHLQGDLVSGLWSREEQTMSINWRELRAIRLGLVHFESRLLGCPVAVFCDNTTAISYLRKQGGTVSSSLNDEAQVLLRWAEEKGVTLLPQFILGRTNVVADALSRRGQVLASEWTLCQEEVNHLLRKWPATVDLFATSDNHRLPVYFSPLHDPMAAGVDSLLQSWDHLQAYAFPPFNLMRPVLNKIRQSQGLEVTVIAPFWPQREWFPDLLDLLVDVPLTLPERPDLLRQPHFHRFHLGLHGLRLHAWRLSSGTPCMKASLETWLAAFRERGGLRQ